MDDFGLKGSALSHFWGKKSAKTHRLAERRAFVSRKAPVVGVPTKHLQEPKISTGEVKSPYMGQRKFLQGTSLFPTGDTACSYREQGPTFSLKERKEFALSIKQSNNQTMLGAWCLVPGAWCLVRGEMSRPHRTEFLV